MKAKVLIIWLAGMLALASCGTRYGHVPKVKGKQQHTAVKKPDEKQRKAEAAVTVAPKKAAIAVMDGSAAVNTEQAAAPTTTTKKVKSRKNRTQLADAPAPGQTETVLKPGTVKKVESIKKQLKQAEGAATHSWLWYIIVGVIFILLAAIIGGLAGYILYVVGVIAVIFGLLALIGIV
ncbi:MAG TPA: hypothetical protein VEC12_07380 [Bacteroidia bacterium]|nr:hypothetical protein [Bacteroidia bacterium]